MTPVGIEPATFRFVAQHLNHCATAVPTHNLHKRQTSVPSAGLERKPKHVNDRRPTPLNARPPGSARLIITMFVIILVSRYSHRILPCGGSFTLIHREFLALDGGPEIKILLNTHACNLRIS